MESFTQFTRFQMAVPKNYVKINETEDSTKQQGINVTL